MLRKMRQMTPHPVAKPGLFLLPKIPCTLEKAKNNHSEVSFTQSNFNKYEPEPLMALELQKFWSDIEEL